MSNRRFATALAAAFADLGVAHACVSPGSRNTPLIAGFAAEDRIKMWPILDERSAGFFALGLAKSTGTPVVLACTSGTAATEYHPAVVEASQSDVPLLVLTADRPEELRNIGAPQTIDQVSLYGTAVRWFIDVEAPGPVTDSTVAGSLATQAWLVATTTPSGPVHLNLPFREPLLDADKADIPTGAPTALADPAVLPDLSYLGDRLSGKTGLIVAGQENDHAFAAACAGLADRTGFPIIADPLSGLRFGAHPLDQVLAHGDHLAAAGVLEAHRPEVVLRFGPVPTSKPVWTWLRAHPEIDQILIDVHSRDATHSAATTLELPPTAAAAAIAASIGTPAPTTWRESWGALDEAAHQLVTGVLTAARFPNEPRIAQIVATAAPEGSAITIGSSMPIRDFDAFGGKSSRRLRLFGNRGANGIDGILSAALGSAAEGSNAVVVLGDVSQFHDLNALGTAARLDLPITIVVINNGGGGIFHFLPHHDPEILEPAVFEKYLVGAHGIDFVAVAQACGIEAHRVDNEATLQGLIGAPGPSPRLIQVETDREENLELHRKVTAKLRSLLR